MVLLDFPTQIVNVHWGGVPEQGLLSTDAGAIALDSGETFPGIFAGASGTLDSSTFTVLTNGVVVYGEPRDGDACFMACIDGMTIRRGIQDVDDADKIAWSTVYTVTPSASGYGLSSLSFAGGAFFVTYLTNSRSASFCAISFDGLVFSEIGNLYAGVPILSDEGGQIPGSVAYNGSRYATAGTYDHNVNSPNPVADDFNMMWATSNDGRSWSSGYSDSETTNPGIRADGIGLPNSGVAYTTIAGGTGLFVTAATDRGQPWPVLSITTTRATAAAATSTDGRSWTTVDLPGVIQGKRTSAVDSSSSSASVVFVRDNPEDETAGYFLISANGGTQTGAVRTTKSWCFRGDGHTWAEVKSASNAGGYFTVSAIAQDLSSTKIVYLRG
jgi:hypothetical protein